MFAARARTFAAYAVALCVVVLGLTLASSAWAKFEVPPNEGPVTDTAGALDAVTKERLAQKLGAIRAQTSYEVTIFVCGSLGGESIDDVAFETFNAWKLGQGGKDNGVLLIVAPHERRDRIEVGKGVEGALTDLETDDIRRKVIEPRLKAGDLAGALDMGASAIAHALVTDSAGTPYPRGGPRGAQNDVPRVFFFVFVIVIVIIVISRGGGRGGPGSFFWFGGGGFGGGGGGGGGGFGGGWGWRGLGRGRVVGGRRVERRVLARLRAAFAFGVGVGGGGRVAFGVGVGVGVGVGGRVAFGVGGRVAFGVGVGVGVGSRSGSSAYECAPSRRRIRAPQPSRIVVP